jgi:hypothetical protein
MCWLNLDLPDTPIGKRIACMGWEDTQEELKPLIERKQELERHVLQSPAQQSGEEHCEWMELRDKIASLTFKRDWEFEQDRFAVNRSQLKSPDAGRGRGAVLMAHIRAEAVFRRAEFLVQLL